MKTPAGLLSCARNAFHSAKNEQPPAGNLVRLQAVRSRPAGKSKAAWFQRMLNSYYADRNVRQRIVEFFGGDRLEDATCKYLTNGDAGELHHNPCPLSELPSCLDKGLEICRSLWDSESLIADLDVEYVNFDHPAEAYLEPGRIFDIQEPVVRTIEKLLLEYGIIPLHTLSGRGHHFIWRIRQNSGAFQRLATLGRVTPSLQRVNARLHTPNGEPVSDILGSAFAGLGLVMELLAHRIKELAAPQCDIPVELTALEVGPSHRDREMISIDISEYGDPLHARMFRVPFSSYLKPQQQHGALGDDVVERLPPLFVIPLHEINTREGILIMREPLLAAELAARASVKIPDQTKGMDRLLTAYLKSSLAKFHNWFYSQEHQEPGQWPMTYDLTPMELLPSCARIALEQPNDLLLRPAGMRMVTRVLLALGWHPRHIAGLIRSKFERNYGWGDQWLECDPATRADFYTRVFAGLFATGRDDLVDFNCQSAKEEQFCFAADCPNNLALFKQSALDRRQYEQLACRPFNRLFLPD